MSEGVDVPERDEAYFKALVERDRKGLEGSGGTLNLLTFRVEFEDERRPAVARQLDSAEALAATKADAFVLPEGCHYRIRVDFRVDDAPVSGVLYTSSHYRKGLRVGREKQMLGSFPQQGMPHSVTFPRHGWEEAPSGMLNRGSYTAKAELHDDEGKALAEFEYAFDIRTA
ncbi:hypothetical protein ACFVYP_01500 [Kitasatospora sp. NPDC058201]|uniref:hypothetical protein n=1 Tax=unclassified Kitasatospora TaxID=2633591 RepID=UPI0036580EA4